jgi:primosomal replication protein N
MVIALRRCSYEQKINDNGEQAKQTERKNTPPGMPACHWLISYQN